MNWHSGIDGGAWEWCQSCQTTTPQTEQGRCATCGDPLERDPVMGTHFAPCENCDGGESLDGDALRGDEAQALMRDEQIDAQRLK